MVSVYFLVSVHLFSYKQKTAYEVRISDWSSDVCSSDLAVVLEPFPRHVGGALAHGDDLQPEHVALARRDVAQEVGDAQPAGARLARQGEARHLPLLRLGIVEDDVRSERRRVGTECVRT